MRDLERGGAPVHLARRGEALGGVAEWLGLGGALEVELLPYGARLGALLLRRGQQQLSLSRRESLAEYQGGGAYIGALVGPVANRLRGGRALLLGQQHQLSLNEGGAHLHGGNGGFHQLLWHSERLEDERGEAIQFSAEHQGNPDGYPGTISLCATYRLETPLTLGLTIEATATSPTWVNCTAHGYFDLSGGLGTEGVGDHELELRATRYLPLAEDHCPTGSLRGIHGHWSALRAGLIEGQSLDHFFVADEAPGRLRELARCRSPESGVQLILESDQPGLQVYLDGERGAPRWFCLEPQIHPDAPNHEHFPSILLQPGERYRWRCRYRFELTEPG